MNLKLNVKVPSVLQVTPTTCKTDMIVGYLQKKTIIFLNNLAFLEQLNTDIPTYLG